MPMIDVYAAAGTFAEKPALVVALNECIMKWESVPPLHLFRDNTATFVHDLPADSYGDATGATDHIRVQVLTPVGVLADREKQLGVVREITDLVVAASGGTVPAERTWVLLYESPDGGWGIGGHAHTGADIAAAARAEIAAG